MTALASLFAPDTMRTLGWSLLHFVWQGFALAAFASVVMTFFRRASARYIIGVLTLFAMVTSVAMTFVLLLNSQSALQATEAAATPVVVFAQKAFLAKTVQPVLTGTPVVKSLSTQIFPLMVQIWLAGVLFFTLRTAGGLIYLERLRRAASVSVAPVLLAKCRELQARLGLQRVIKFCECRWLDAPAVIGWFRPVVLLPVRALTGLTEDQIEAVIAHELAHIRRFDAFINLFQVTAESLLFFHPAVWWLNKRVRAERENCCDDIAVAACGNHLDYARALTTMEEWRASPAFSLAANGSPLAARISRILDLRHAAENRTAGLGAGFACFAAALVAGSLLYGVSHPAEAARVKTAIVSSWADDVAPEAVPRQAAPAPKPSAKAAAKPSPTVQPDPQETPQPSAKSSYIDEMKSVGIDTNDIDRLVALKIQGVTAQYVREMRAAGFTPNVDELIGMKIQGVTPEYVQKIRDLGYKPDAGRIMGMKIQGVTPEYVKEIRSMGFQPNEDEIVGMKIQGVTPEYIKEMRSLGFDPNAEQIMGMRIQGVTPEYVKALEAEGYKLNANQVTEAKIMGITPEFIQKAKSHGFTNLSIEKLIQLKNADIF